MPKTTNASYIKQWRKKEKKEKRFSRPLREYLELKHRDIYCEYCHFFKSLDEQYPSAKNLTKTPAYKNWKNRQLNCESDDENKAEHKPTEAEHKPTEAEHKPTEAEHEPAEVAEQVEIETTELENNHTDILSLAMPESLSPDINIDINKADEIIQRIINELEEEGVIRDILNNDDDELVNEDEGISLNVEMELESIVEPFDYQLEVEGVDF